jgi:hypothetical protein
MCSCRATCRCDGIGSNTLNKLFPFTSQNPGTLVVAFQGSTAPCTYKLQVAAQ